MPGNWQVTPIVIDGDNKDWPSPYPEYDEKAMLGYAVSNDKNNLYITVETGDAATQLKILHEGLTVWIDRTGEKSEETAINFPLPVVYAKGAQTVKDDEAKRPGQSQSLEGQGGSRDQKQRMYLEDKVRALLPKADQYSLQGFKSCNLQYAITEKDSCGIEVKIGLDANNELIWEAVIPFKSFYFKPELTRPDKGKVLTVCFETTGSKRPAGQANGNNGRGSGMAMRPSVGIGGFGGMGMGMRMGGGGGGYRGGNRGGSPSQSTIMEPLYKSTKTYKKFGLAFQ